MSLAPQSTQSLLVSTEVKAPAPLTLVNPIARQSLLFIDSSVAGAETLMKTPGAYLLDRQGDAIAQMSQVLAGHRDVASVQIVSHGRSGGLFLGQDWLDVAGLQNRADEIRAWQSSLTSDADVLLFGCEVAAGSLGLDFVGVLAALSGADVAASDDLTGSRVLGGDWDLEVETGAIGSVALFQAEQSDYEGVLGTIVVTNTDASGVGSFAQAIADANSIAGTDTIIFSGSVFTDATPDTITPDSTVSITSDLSIIAPVGITISGNNARQVFTVGSGRTATVQNLTIANGLSSGGGGIYNLGFLTLSNVVVKDNVATGASGDGGGIYNLSSGNLTIQNSTIENNTSSDDGGGIRNDGTLTILNSTISGNTATSASSIASGGGGLLNVGTATITNTTFSGNTALNGGAIRNDGTLTLLNDTITANTATGNGGGLLNTINPITLAIAGRTTIKNTIVAGNTDTTPIPSTTNQYIIDIAGGLNSFTDDGNNLLGAADTLNSTIAITTLRGTTLAPLDPKLDILASNGGKTKTHAILAGSPAINTGTDTGAPTGDQRGAGRNGTADIGAFEFDGAINAAPTAVALQNIVDIPDGQSTIVPFNVADIVITDDGLGTNVITISGPDAARFTIAGTQLFLAPGGSIDFETKNQFNITLSVDDPTVGASPDLTQNFVINVADVNDAPTAIALTNTVTQLPDSTNATTGVKVADILITDDALGTETFTLTGADSANFEVRLVAGLPVLFFTAAILNPVTKPSYAVTVTAKDLDLPFSTPLSASFFLTIQDINDPPTNLILQNPVTAIAENTSTATAIKLADITFTDDTTGVNTIAITGADAGKFDLVGNGLFLKAGTVLDFETKPSYAVTVTVDDATLGTTAELTENLVLTVTNLNEAPTVLALANPVTTLLETANTVGGVKVADIAITDDALGDETITVIGTDAASFELRDGTGGKELFFIGTALNALTKPSYSVSVSAIDQAIAGSTALTQSFTLSITDVNSPPTGLVLQNAVNAIDENTSTATAVKVADIDFTDDGTGTNTIALSGADAAKFNLVGNAIFLKAGTVLDFETQPSYAVTITVDDATLGTTAELTENFVLTVRNINEAPTALALVNPVTSLTATTSTTGGIKVADITITDDALGDETLTVIGADAASFEIRDVAGAKALFLIAPSLNAVTKPSYSVSVSAIDGTIAGSTALTQPFTLAITNVNAAPTALAFQNAVTSIAENTSTTAAIKVADLVITDEGLGTNTIALGGADAAKFSVVGTGLFLNAGTVLDFETKATYDVTVTVDDSTIGTTPDLTLAFTLAVTNVNEAPTALALTPTTLILAENTPTNIKVADITVTDDALGTERFILSGSDASSFEVRPVTGGQALFLTANLDFESQPNYSVTVEAIDDTIIGSNPISKTFTLAITNQNDPTVGSVTINGNPAPGNTLTSSNTLFDQDVIRIYAYQWQSSTDGINFNDITIAKSASFSVTPAQAGQRLRLKLTTTDGLQNVTSTFSAPTGIISNTPVPPIPNPTPLPIPTPAALSAISTVASQTIAQWLPNLTTANYPSGSSYVITTDRPDLFETPPTIAPNGTLTYGLKPGLEVNQTINITVQVKQPDGTINPTTTVRSTLNLRFRAEALVRNTRTEELGLLYIDQVNQIQGAKPITLGQNFGAQAGKSVPLNAQWKIVDTKDFNRDGVADILFQNSTLDEMAIWMMNSSGQIMDGKWLTGSDGQRLRTQNPNWKAVGFADIDNDRNLDIVWHNQQTDEIAFWFLQSDGFSVKSYDYLRDSNGGILKTKNPGWQLSKLGDFDGDGDTDLLFRLPELNQTAIIRLQGKTFVDAQLLGTSPDSSLVIRGVGDYNGDRIADIYWQTPQNDRVVVQPLTFQAGRWISESFITIASGGNRPLQGIADLDRNSTDDLLFLDPTTNGLLVKPVEQANGAPTVVQQQGRTFNFSGADWSIVQTDEFGDFV